MLLLVISKIPVGFVTVRLRFTILSFTNYDYNTHNHLLLKGEIIGEINTYLRRKSLIGNHVKYEPYEKGASMYVILRLIGV